MRLAVDQALPMDDLAPLRTALAMFSSPTISSSPGKCSSDKLDLSYHKYDEYVYIRFQDDNNNFK